MKESLEKLVRYCRVLSETMKLSLREDENEVTLVFLYRPEANHHPSRRVAVLALILEMCRINWGKEFVPKKVEFTIDHPLCKETYQRNFGSEIEFSSENDCLIFSQEDVNLVLPSANAKLARMNDQVIDNYLQELDKDSLIQKVKSRITEKLSSGKVTDDIIAAKLHMSVRSLQRKLQREGTTFRSLLDEAREHLARKYIKGPTIRLEEIAFLTGFSEYSSFSRAFNRWSGHSPSELRALN